MSRCQRSTAREKFYTTTYIQVWFLEGSASCCVGHILHRAGCPLSTSCLLENVTGNELNLETVLTTSAVKHQETDTEMHMMNANIVKDISVIILV